MYLNKLLLSNERIFSQKIHSHIVVLPHGDLKFNDFSGEFVINWKGSSYLRVDHFSESKMGEEKSSQFQLTGR